MELDANSIQEIIKKAGGGYSKQTITKAVLLQQRLKFHTETNLSIADINQPTTVFIDWVSKLLPKDKFNVFLQLFSFPLPTAAIVEDVYRELERVFYSRNSNSSYVFTDNSYSDDWRTYKHKVLDEPNVWKTDGWQNMKTAINSVLIVDLPKTQTTERPSPYFYWLDIQNVFDFFTTDGNTFEWLITKIGDEHFAVFDSKYYRIVKIEKATNLIKIEETVEHNLGYCPARFFWTNFAIESNKSIKKNSIVKQLSNLDWLLFFMISKRHLDLYAPYPIYSAYEAECSFENNETGSYCDGGFLRNSSGHYIISRSGLLDRCPICAEKRIAGPGSFLEVPIPGTDTPDLRNPVQITTVDSESLVYNVSECIRLKNEVIISCVGSNGLVSEKEAINETQVAANFENKTSVLNSIKVNFENAQKFVEDTICRLRYGSEFISSSINWGSEFYIFTVDELYKKYKTAKDNGASMSELDSLMNQIIETEYKDNPPMLHRMQLLKQIEPFRHLTVTEVLALYSSGLASKSDTITKINMSSLIDLFERENTNIVDFGSKINIDSKIKIINKKIKEYVEKGITEGTFRLESPTQKPA